MSEQMDFEDGKYTVIYDEGHFKALRYGQPWRDLTGDNLVYAVLVKAIQLKEERDELEAKLKELEGQEPIVQYSGRRLTPEGTTEVWGHLCSEKEPKKGQLLFARPVPAQPNANGWIPWAGGECPLGRGVFHQVRLRNGDVSDWSEYPDRWHWDHNGSATDLIAYRVMEAQP